jgi:diguanylate cyclase (GGDEF)-like protein
MSRFARLSFKVYGLLLIGFFAVLAILAFSIFAKRYYYNSYNIMYNLNMLDKFENQLNYNILYSSLFLYYDNDKISINIKRINNLIEKVEKDKFFMQHYTQAYIEFLKYKDAFLKKEDLIFEYMRYSLPIKNSLIYLANSLKFMNIDDKGMKQVLSVLSSVFLAKNAGDIDFVKNIDLKQIENLKNSHDKYKRAFYMNLKVFLKYYPKYSFYLKKIINSPTSVYINNAFEKFKEKLSQDLRFFEKLSYLLIGFIIFLISLLIFVIIKLEDKIKEVYYLLEHDNLTALRNRYKFNKDIKNYKKPQVILFNIDKFKNINDYFGSNVGDKLLKDVGRLLRVFFRQLDNKIKVYRVGADDFAVILEKDSYSLPKLKDIAKKAIDFVENRGFTFNNLTLNISLSAGISTKGPYLENADIALKNIKNDIKEKIGVYEEKMNKDISLNIQKSNEIKDAIENNRIIPYFQPIFDKNMNVYKYEVLSRVIIRENEIKSIYPYLNILKENKMYHRVTEIILNESVYNLKKYSNLSLSINLSIEDIINSEIVKLIKRRFSNQEIAKRVTFEILESEIENYDALKTFIADMKQYGITFAIDDFGSGYSNFSRVLNLEVDYLKIDGSLIKNIDTDKNSRLIVETIVDFAKKSDKKTVAEFVHSKNIFEITKSLDIDYFQGFYLGEPKPNINL